MPPKNRRNNILDEPPAAPRQRLAVFGVNQLDDFTHPLARNPIQARPTKLKDSFKVARGWVEGKSGFIQMITRIRAAFYHHGFQVLPYKALEQDTPEFQKFDAWRTSHQALLEQYARDAMLEWLTVDNVVALWRTPSVAQTARPFRVRPEECDYQDKFALEILKFSHGVTQEELSKMIQLTRAQREALVKPEIELIKNDERLFGFEVLKRSAVGDGLAWPGTQSAFLGASAHESLEVADAQLASLMRRVYEVHRKGHETKYGLNAGGKQNNLTEAYKDKFLRTIKGKRGALELVLNWDHLIEWPRPDPKHFDKRRYEAAMASLMQWAMPVGHMLLATTMNPFLFELFRELARWERQYVREHLVKVFTRTLKPPVPITCEWSDAAFVDARLRFDMLKFGVTCGAVSQETYMERMGEDPARERQRKKKEAALPKEVTRPTYDPAHGDPERAGRKAGTGDHQGGD